MSRQVINSISQDLSKILQRYVSGSNYVTVEDLIDEEDFSLSFIWTTGKESTPRRESLFEHIIKETLQRKRTLKRIILSDPGVGKSTVSYILYFKLFELFKSEKSALCPIFIDLSEFIGDTEFGTSAWIDQHLDILAGKTNVEWVSDQDSFNSYKIVPFFILDSLDEYLCNSTLAEIQSTLNKPIFKEANFISCRAQFFEYYISGVNKIFTKSFKSINLYSWEESYKRKYAVWYLTKFFRLGGNEIQTFLNQLLNSPDLDELCKIPIRYNMVLEILAENGMNYDLVKDLISIYHNYVVATIKHESSRIGSVVPIDEKLACLKILAWTFYDEAKIGDEFQKIRFTVKNMQDALTTSAPKLNLSVPISVVVKDIINCSVLLEDINDEYHTAYSCLKFSHKSIQEFFVAKYIFDEIINSSSIGELTNIYQCFFSQEIDVFMKDYIQKINSDLRLSDIACSNLINAYKSNEKFDEDPNPENLFRTGIARDQIGYTLGHLKSPKAIAFINKALETEEKEFVRRSMLIGLAIGGNSILDEYVDKLRINTESNAVNIGFQLSYFGDQPFNIFEPYIDQNLPRCRNTVQKLMQALRNKNNKGAWRIDLYTIIYLSKNREISKRDFWTTISEQKENFGDILKRLNNDPACKNWPEIKEGFEILKSINYEFE